MRRGSGLFSAALLAALLAGRGATAQNASFDAGTNSATGAASPASGPADTSADAAATTAPATQAPTTPTTPAATSPQSEDSPSAAGTPTSPPTSPTDVEPSKAPANGANGSGLIDPAMSRSWWEGGNRWFFSAVVDAGYLYLRPRASVGWGRPFARWIGIDANPVVSGAGMAAYGGLRFALDRVDLRVGSRYFYAFRHAYLPPLASLGRLDLDSLDRPRATMLTHEAELNASIPAGPGDILTLLSVSYVTGVPADSLVFEETLKVVVDPPLVWRVRGGYLLRFGKYEQHSVGLVADVLSVPKRDPGTTVRAGPVTRIVLSRHFEVRGTFVVPFLSPDRLGITGGDFAELGVRYRWATD